MSEPNNFFDKEKNNAEADKILRDAWDKKIIEMLTEPKERLADCPFCGGEVIRDHVNDEYHADISCAECGQDYRMTNEQWNRRAIPPVEVDWDNLSRVIESYTNENPKHLMEHLIETQGLWLRRGEVE